MNTYIIYAFIAMVLWGVSDFLMQYFVRKIGRIATLAWVGVFGSIALFPFVKNDLGIIFNANNYYFLFFLALLHILSAILLFSAFKYGKLSVVETIMIAELPLTIFWGILFFKEVLTLEQTLIVGAIFGGIILASLKRQESKIKQLFLPKAWIEKGVFLSLSAVLVISLINYFTASNARLTTPFLAIWFPWFIFAVFSLSFLVLKKDVKTAFLDLRKNWLLILIMCIANSVAWITFSIATTKLNFSLLASISMCYPMIAIFLGVLVHKEKLSKIQYVGITIALLCSALLGFYSSF